MYLDNQAKNKSAYHLWNERANDTLCRMWQAGGMRQDRPGYVLVDDPPQGKWLCHMCRQRQTQPG